MTKIDDDIVLADYVGAFVDELVCSKVFYAVISPGSRSTPLAYAMFAHEKIKKFVNIDERSSAFFALGLAKSMRAPVILLCTSGTAAANFLPAIVEANLSHIPLIVVTADRPPELRDVCAPQTIDQNNLYGSHAKWFIEMPIPENKPEVIEFVRSVACRSASLARTNPSGAVHLNFPFREPLIPNFTQMRSHFYKTRAKTKVLCGKLTLSNETIDKIHAKITGEKKVLLVCGALTCPKAAHAVQNLAQKTGFPLIADPLSFLRTLGGSSRISAIDCYDSFLRSKKYRAMLKPDVILRFGAMPVSKTMNQFLHSSNAYEIVIDKNFRWNDPSSFAKEIIYCDEVIFCASVSNLFSKAFDYEYGKLWHKVNSAAKAQIKKYQEKYAEFCEVQIFAKLQELLPDKSNLVIGNSMAIREVDSFFHNTNKKINLFCNRGANGIDGLIATALGVSAASNLPTYLVVGDLSFLHDLNSLIFAKMEKLSLCIIVINNDGGGIFSFLPQAQREEYFAELFLTSHGTNFDNVAKMVDGIYRRADNLEQFSSGFLECDPKKLSVLEVITRKSTNVSEHKKMIEFISSEINL